jgi:hypothetical protein
MPNLTRRQFLTGAATIIGAAYVAQLPIMRLIAMTEPTKPTMAIPFGIAGKPIPLKRIYLPVTIIER